MPTKRFDKKHWKMVVVLLAICNNKKSLDACPFCYTPLSRTRDMQDTGMPTKRFDKKHWKMVVVLLAICGAMLLLRWAAMIWG